MFEKIKACRLALIKWCIITFGNTRIRLNSKQQELEELTNGNYGGNLGRINDVCKEINELLHHEEVFWRQRARSIWLLAGDKNNKFFHQRACQRQHTNHIEGLQDGQGLWHTNHEHLATIAKDHYKELFTTSNPQHMEGVLSAVDRVVSDEMNHTLDRPYIEEEVRVALFQMHPSKAPRPDDMSPFFFQKYWHIIGPDITTAVLSVLHSGKCLHKMNFTHIVLIPKKVTPRLISDYRPISLGNVVSRIVSKVLANCIKTVLPNIISDSQSAFVPDRLITNNTTVAFKMICRMRNRRKGKVGHVEVKLDISKAYDRVEWRFLRKIMLKLGLSEQWVNLAMETVCTTSYSVLINGEPKGFVTPSRGI